MSPKNEYPVEVDEEGRLVLPPEVRERFGFRPGSPVRLTEGENSLGLLHSTMHLAKVYIEVTSRCNLNCRTCIRNTWNELQGDMSAETFERVLDGLKGLPVPVDVFFGGFGEPLAHPEILEMVKQAKQVARSVELITNGILLDERRARALIDLGLDTLWVSIDGASPECYADVRREDHLPQVLANLERLRDLKIQTRCPRPTLGISFVAMRRNLAELPEVLKLEHRVGARKFLVSNVYPHTPELLQEILYRRSIGESLWNRATIRMARMDPDQTAAGILQNVLHGLYTPRLEGPEVLWPSNTCPFVSRGSTCVRWDGHVSPCLPLLHGHTSYLENRVRRNGAYAIGSIRDRDLLDLWESPEYVVLRKRLEEFDFSPCTACNSCELADENREDCFGNSAPTCGGCLWAQGFILCP